MTDDSLATPTWRPLRARRGGDEGEKQYDVLHEGVPPWLSVSLMRWVHDRLHASFVDGYGGSRRDWSASALLQLQRELRIEGWDWSSGPASAGDSLLQSLTDDDLFLEVVDYLFRDLVPNSHENEKAVVSLIVMLREAGSCWKVVANAGGRNGFELQQRVPETVSSAAAEVFRTGRPGDHLRMAWSAAYRKSPNPNEAYDQAV